MSASCCHVRRIAVARKGPSWRDHTLEFAISSLNLLMVTLLHVALENAGSGGLVEAGSLQDMCSIDPIVGLTSHDMLPFGIRASELVLPYWILRRRVMLA